MLISIDRTRILHWVDEVGAKTSPLLLQPLWIEVPWPPKHSESKHLVLTVRRVKIKPELHVVHDDMSLSFILMTFLVSVYYFSLSFIARLT